MNENEGTHTEQGAGDQGIMYGYACNETDELMPLPITLAHGLTRQLAKVRKEKQVDWMRPDGKAQVTVEYENGKPVRVDAIVVSAQHSPDVSHEEIEKEIMEKVIQPVCAQWIDESTKYHINPTGKFVI